MWLFCGMEHNFASHWLIDSKAFVNRINWFINLKFKFIHSFIHSVCLYDSSYVKWAATVNRANGIYGEIQRNFSKCDTNNALIQCSSCKFGYDFSNKNTKINSQPIRTARSVQNDRLVCFFFMSFTLIHKPSSIENKIQSLAKIAQ